MNRWLCVKSTQSAGRLKVKQTWLQHVKIEVCCRQGAAQPGRRVQTWGHPCTLLLLYHGQNVPGTRWLVWTNLGHAVMHLFSTLSYDFSSESITATCLLPPQGKRTAFQAEEGFCQQWPNALSGCGSHQDHGFLPPTNVMPRRLMAMLKGPCLWAVTWRGVHRVYIFLLLFLCCLTQVKSLALHISSVTLSTSLHFLPQAGVGLHGTKSNTRACWHWQHA